MSFFEFPHTRTYDSDLGWLIYHVKKLADEMQLFEVFNEIKYADPLQWSIETSYMQNTVVIDPATGDAYLSTKAVPSGILLSNTDYWTKIFNYSGRLSPENAFVFPEQFGAVGDGITDDTAAWQECINFVADAGGEIHGYGDSKYLITQPLNIPYHHPISINGAGTRIVVGADMTTIFDIGYDKTSADLDYNAGLQKPMIHHIILTNDGTHKANFVATIATGVKDYEFHNMITYGTRNGLRIGDGIDRIIPADIQVHDCLFYGDGAEYDSCGMLCYNSDNVFDNLRIYGFQRGFDFYSSSQVFNVHVLLRWHDQRINNFYPYTPGGSEWNDYYPKTAFAALHTAGVIPFNGCYHDGIHTFLFVYESGSRIQVNGLFYLGHSAANTGGNDVIDITNVPGTEKTIHINMSCAYINFGGDNRSSYGIRCGSGKYISRFSRIMLENIELSGYRKMANAADLILSGTALTDAKYNSFVANEWVVVGAIANVKNKIRALIEFELNSNPFEIEFDITASNTLSWIYDRGMNQQSDVTFGFWYSQQFNALMICVKLSNNATAPTNIRLKAWSSETTAPAMILPAYAANADQTDPYIHTLLLSELTSSAPLTDTYTRPLKNLYPTTGAIGNVTIPANGMLDVAVTYTNVGRDVDSGVFMFNQTVNNLSITTAYNITRSGANVRLQNTSASVITVTTLSFSAILFKK